MDTKYKEAINNIYLETQSYAETGRLVKLSRQRVYQIVTGKQSPGWWNKLYYLQRKKGK